MFEKKVNFDFATTQEMIRRIGFIDLFKGKWAGIEQRENKYLRELKKIATIESIGSSTRIEGATLTDKEVADLIKNMKITQFQSRDEEEVFGYFECLDLIFAHFKDLNLTENNLKQLHSILLKHSQKDQNHRGQYKTLSNQVVANYPSGGQRVIFRTTLPHLTEKEMHEMLDSVNRQMDSKSVHPLLLIAFFVYEFLSIHPFQDGNGRMSRLLTTLLLLRADYPFVQYISFEHLIEERKQDYYRVLMSAQQHRGTEQEIIGEWVLFFLDCLASLIEKLEAKYDVYHSKGRYLNARQNGILDFVKNNQPIKLADLAAKFPEIPSGTLKKDILHLVTEHFLNRFGNGRATIYLFKNEK